jgi:hypothetical protein
MCVVTPRIQGRLGFLHGLDPEDEGDIFFRNVALFPELQSRIPHSYHSGL